MSAGADCVCGLVVLGVAPAPPDQPGRVVVKLGNSFGRHVASLLLSHDFYVSGGLVAEGPYARAELVCVAEAATQNSAKPDAPAVYLFHEKRAKLLSQSLREVLVKTGALAEGTTATGPELLNAAADYCDPDCQAAKRAGESCAMETDQQDREGA